MTLHTTDILPTKTYPFKNVRRLLQILPDRQGIIGLEDFKVKQRGAGANMSVDVAAGDAWVNGTSNSNQGIYHSYNDATVNVGPFTEANATNPRVDQVILFIPDSSEAGATDEPKFVVITGTATAGAQITTNGAAGYRSGAVSEATIRATYPNYLWLADVLVPSKATVIENSNIVDRRVSAIGTTSRGSCIILGEQTRESTSFGTMATPDEVTVVLPENGLIYVAFEGMWKSSIAGAGRAQLFLNSNEVVMPSSSEGSPSAVNVNCGSSGTWWQTLSCTAAKGMFTGTATEANQYTGDVTTGQLIGNASGGDGGPAVLFAAAGIYKVSIQFRATSGSVTAKNRKLWVKAEAF